jgi:hypothetical protein
LPGIHDDIEFVAVEAILSVKQNVEQRTARGKENEDGGIAEGEGSEFHFASSSFQRASLLLGKLTGSFVQMDNLLPNDVNAPMPVAVVLVCGLPKYETFSAPLILPVSSSVTHTVALPIPEMVASAVPIFRSGVLTGPAPEMLTQALVTSPARSRPTTNRMKIAEGVFMGSSFALISYRGEER